MNRVSKSFSILFRLSTQLVPLASISLFVPAPKLTAQVTTANFRGSIQDTNGKPIADASVQLEHGPSQNKKTMTTNREGQYAFNGLRVGGPYSIKVSKSGFSSREKSDISLKAGSNETLTLIIDAAEVMQVVGDRSIPLSQKKMFFSSDVRDTPSIGQDIKDLVKRSANAYVDGQSLSIGGANNRYNSTTIDGMRQDDDFGLNGNGYPTQRSPISLLAVEEISVEQSPFDVRFSNFLGGNVNVVTKSGTNDFAGSVMATYSGKGLVGKKSKDRTYDFKAQDQRLSFTLGGPIVQDKVHFFLSMEGLTSTSPNIVGPAGSGQPIEVTTVTADEVARAQAISESVYGFNAGSVGQTIDASDFKMLAKVDWTINDDHRLEAKYQHSTGSTISDAAANATNLPLTSYWFKRKDTLDTLSLRLFSDWGNDISTKLEVSQKQVVAIQDPLNGNDFMAADITTADKGLIRLGPDPFRHTNDMKNSTRHLGAEANYLAGDHQIVGGIEHDKVDIFNLFVPESNGLAAYASLDDFEARKPSRLTYTDSVTGNTSDAAADWSYGVTGLYLQDEINISEDLTARVGVRTDLYSADGKLPLNENFQARYGFDNTATIQSKQVIKPRLSMSYKVTPRLGLRSGFGLYSGGTPNVWLSNSYSNNGVSTDRATTTSADGFNGRDIPDSLKNELQAGDGNVDALDPNFKIPQSWKYAVGGNYRFDIPFVMDNVLLDFDYTYTKTRSALLWRDLRRNFDFGVNANNQPTAVGPDGRDLYDTDSTVTGATDFNSRRGYDMLLTNTDQGYGQVASLSLSKNFASGFNFGSSYAWQDVKDVNPGNSSRSATNYGQVAIADDPNNPGLERSSFERKHRILFNAGYTKKFWEELATSFNLFVERRSGQPYSYTFGGKRDSGLFGEEAEFTNRERMLFYVPKGDGSDVILDGIDQGQFDAFIKRRGLEKYRGKIMPRNSLEGSWVSKMDMRVSQDLPSYGEKTRTRLVFDVENLPNLVNKKWGQVKQVGFPYFTPAVDVDYDAATGRYRYSELVDRDPETIRIAESVWRMQLAVFYDF